MAIFTKKLDQQFYNAGGGKGLYKMLDSQKRTRKLRYRFHSSLERLKKLRNRIAHHVPLIHSDLARAHALLLELAGYIDQDTATWIAYHSQFHKVWNNPPMLTQVQIDRIRAKQASDKYFKV